jgi:hypothetical protein
VRDISFSAITLRLLALACAVLLVGCRITVVAEPGGRVITATGDGDCSPGESCMVDVINGSVYEEIFTGEPDPGFVFTGWKEEYKHLCGGSKSPCALLGVPPNLTSIDVDLMIVAQFERSPITVPGLPATLARDALLDVQVQAPVRIPVTDLELAYGPAGMSLDANGRLTWQPDIVMVGSEQLINFGIGLKSDPGYVANFSIELLDADGSQMVSRSGIAASKNEYSMWIGQFDSDSAPEILTADTRRIMTAEVRDGSLVQDWLYPFALDTQRLLSQVVGADLDGDGVQEVIALTSGSVFLIRDRGALAIPVFEAASEFDRVLSVATADTDADTAIELVLLVKTGSGLDSILLIDSDTLEVERTLPVELRPLFMDTMILTGNVDADPAPEAVLRDGYVIDLVSGAVEWDYGQAFGTLAALADVNGDDIAEIFASQTWGDPALFSATEQRKLWDLGIDDGLGRCSLGATDFDGDNSDELVVGHCQGMPGLEIYDATLASATLKADIPERLWDPESIAAGDVDDDGDIDLAFATRPRGGPSSSLGIALQDTGDLALISNTSPTVLGEFEAAGVASQPGSGYEAVFVAPDTYQNAQRLVLMDLDGQLRVSAPYNDPFQTRGRAEVADYDKDQTDEIILSSMNILNDLLEIVSADTLASEWVWDWADTVDDIAALAVADMNGDGFTDAVVANGRGISVIDIYHQVELWRGGDYENFEMIQAGDLTGDGRPEILVSTISINPDIGVRLRALQWHAQSQSYAEYLTSGTGPGQGCARAEIADIDEDPGVEILCLVSAPNNAITAQFKILKPDFSMKWSFALPYAVTDFAIESRPGPLKNILVAAAKGNRLCVFNCTGDSRIQAVSVRDGRLIWESPLLLGEPKAHSLRPFQDAAGRRRLAFSSKYGMHITH